jgi:hypothetical protein
MEEFRPILHADLGRDDSTSVASVSRLALK